LIKSNIKKDKRSGLGAAEPQVRPGQISVKQLNITKLVLQTETPQINDKRVLLTSKMTGEHGICSPIIINQKKQITMEHCQYKAATGKRLANCRVAH
jgi:hypothetical protein